MQLVKTARDNLLRPVEMVSGIVERKHTLPVLTNLLIRKENNTVFFLSTDTEIQVTTSASIGADEENAAITVGARKLVDILRALPDTSDVSITLTDNRLIIQSGTFSGKLQTLPADDFPTVPIAPQYKATLTIQQKMLKELFGAVHFAMALQDIRYYLQGLLLIVDGKTLTAVATDGHRLALNHIETDVACEHNQVIIPRKTVLELQRLLSDTDDSVQIDLADNQIRFTFGSIELLSKLVEGKFPNHERVVPKGYKNRLSINRESLQHALQRTTILPEKLKAVRLLLDAGTLKISSHNEQEEATEEIETDYTGDRIDIGFNAAYILDILSNQKSDKVVVELGDSNSSILVTFPDKTTIKHVVMPMRI